LTAGNQCLDCDDSCLECFGSLDTECSQCISGDFLYLSNFSCVDDCSYPQYLNDTSVVDNHTCDANSTYVPVCTTGTFLNVTENICQDCHNHCEECLGGSEASDCTSCKSPLAMNMTSLLCEPACNVDQYFDEVGFSCEDCHESCATCDGSNA